MITITVNPTIIRVEGEKTRIIEVCSDAPVPFESFEEWEGFVTMRTTPSNLVHLFINLPSAIWNDPTGQLIEARAMNAIQAQDRPRPGEYEERWPFRVTPKPFQLEVFAAARHMTKIALTPVATGTGKSKMGLDIAADKFMRDEIDGVCIIAPNGVQSQWVKRAIPEHMTGAVMPVRSAVWSPTRNTPAAVSEKLFRGERRLRVLTFNVEAFSSESGKAFRAAREFIASGRMMLIIDESSRIKSPKAIRTKTIWKLTPYAKVVCTMSGTPITRGLEDLFSQYYALDPAIIGSTNYYAFRNRYCVTVPAFYGAAPGQIKITGYRNVDEFIRKIAPHTFVVPKDVLGLPEKTYETREVMLTDEQKRVYKMLKDELVEDLRTHKIKSPANAAVRLVRLQQVLCGTKIEIEEDNSTEENLVITTAVAVPSRRLEALYSVLTEHQGPAVIWCRFTDDIKDIESFLTENDHSCVTYFGETSNADRAENVRKFRTGEAQYFISNPDAGGTGLDGLQDVAELAVYYSNSFKAESRWQSEDRLHRLGMRGRCHIVDLVAPDTVDELVLKNLKDKGNLARAVFSNPSILEDGVGVAEAA